MPKSDTLAGSARRSKKAVALQYGPDDAAPVVVASGMGYLAERIVGVAQEHGVPVYEDDSLATLLTQLNLGQEIPAELYQAIVEIYVYFLNFDPKRSETHAAPSRKGAGEAASTEEAEAETEPEAEGGELPEGTVRLQEREIASLAPGERTIQPQFR